MLMADSTQHQGDDGSNECAACNEVVATDGDRELIEGLTRTNIASNATGSSDVDVRASVLLWGDREAEAALSPPFDLVLAADVAACVYGSAFEALVGSLLRLSSPESTILLSFQRRHSSETDFFALLQQTFHVQRLPIERVHCDFRDRIQIFSLRHREGGGDGDEVKANGGGCDEETQKQEEQWPTDAEER
jgi:hypothetical protein